MIDRDRLNAYIQSTITPRANSTSLLMCLKSIVRNDESAAVEYLHSICEMDPFLAVQTVTLLPENQMNMLIPVIHAWILDHAKNDTVSVKDLSAILGLKDRELFRMTKDAMTADLMLRFFQDCPCSIGCRMMRYCYELDYEEIIGACEVALGQMLNRYDTEADEELGLLIPEIAKHNAKFLLSRLIEIMGLEQMSNLSMVSMDDLESILNSLSVNLPKGEAGNNQTDENSYSQITHRQLIDHRSQFNELMEAMSHLSDDEVWEKVEESVSDLTDLLLFIYINRFLSQPHTEEELLVDGLWRAQMYAINEKNVLRWFYLSVLEKLGESHPLLKYISVIDDQDKIPHVLYLDRCKTAIISLLDCPDHLSSWIEVMREANPYSFSHEHMVSYALQENEQKTLHDALKHYFDIRMDTDLLIKLFLNTPMRCLIPIRILLQMGKDYGRLDQLLESIKPFHFFAKQKRSLTKENTYSILPCNYVGEEPIFIERDQPKISIMFVTYQIIGFDDEHILACEFKNETEELIAYDAKASEYADQQTIMSSNSVESTLEEAHASVEKGKPSALREAIAEKTDDLWEKSLTLIKTAAILLRRLPSNAPEKDKKAIMDEGCEIAQTLDFLPECFESQFDLDRMTQLLNWNMDQFPYLAKIICAMKWNEIFSDASSIIHAKYFTILNKYGSCAKWLFRDLFSKEYAEHTIVSFYLQSIYKTILPLHLFLSYGDRDSLLTELKNWLLPVREIKGNYDEPIYRLMNLKCTSYYSVITCDNWEHPAGFLVRCIAFENDGGHISNIIFQEEENASLIKERKRKRQNYVFAHLAQKTEINERERKEIQELPSLDQYIWDDVALPLRCMNDAVNIRRNEPGKILEMLDLLGDKNPFYLQKDIRIELYYLQMIFKAEQRNHYKNVMISIIMNAECGKDIVRIYFHTGLKYYVTLNSLWEEVHMRRPSIAIKFEEALQVWFFSCAIGSCGSVWCPYLEQNSFLMKNPSSKLCYRISVQGDANGKMEIASISRFFYEKHEILYIVLSCFLLGYQLTQMVIPFESFFSQFNVPLRPGKRATDPICIDDLLSAIICADRDASFIAFYQKKLRKVQRSRKINSLPKDAFSCQLITSVGSYVRFLIEELNLYQYHQNVKNKMLDEISLRMRDDTFSQNTMVTNILPRVVQEYLFLFHDRTIVDDAAERVNLFYGMDAANNFREIVAKQKIYNKLNKLRNN